MARRRCSGASCPENCRFPGSAHWGQRWKSCSAAVSHVVAPYSRHSDTLACLSGTRILLLGLINSFQDGWEASSTVPQASLAIFTKLPESTATIRWVRTNKRAFHNLVSTGHNTSKAGWLMPKHSTFGIDAIDIPYILTLYKSALWNIKSKNHIISLQKQEDHKTCSQKVLPNKIYLSLWCVHIGNFDVVLCMNLS